MDFLRINKMNRWLFRQGLSESDYRTLRLSKRLLQQIFQPPKKPEHPYGAIPLLSPLWMWLKSQISPGTSEHIQKKYHWQLERVEEVSHRHACIRVHLWHQLVQYRGHHLQKAIQRQLEDTIESALHDNPEQSLVRTRLIAEEVDLKHWVFKQEAP